MPFSLPSDNVLTARQAELDLVELRGHLQRVHPAFRQGIPETVQIAFNEALSRIKSEENVTALDLRKTIQSILSPLNDGHTCAYVRIPDKYLGDWGKMKAEGYLLESVNGEALSEIFTQNKRLYSFELESWGQANLIDDLTSLDGLHFLGYKIEDGIEMVFRKGNSRITRIYKEEDFLARDEYFRVNAQYGVKKEPFVSYFVDKQNNYALFTLNSCNFNDEYKKTLQKFFTEVKAAAVENVIVDLRKNSGGNSMVAEEFIRYLDTDTFRIGSSIIRLGPVELKMGGYKTKNKKVEDLAFTGNVFVLTSAKTFSSAMMFTYYIQDNGLGRLVGEAPGNAANGYGEVVLFRLANSGIFVQMSSTLFLRSDATKGVEVVPDYQCSSEEALEKAVAIITGDF